MVQSIKIGSKFVGCSLAINKFSFSFFFSLGWWMFHNQMVLICFDS